MKILIISGFLGAGKTTFIKELVKQTKKNFVVLENEYGGVNVDSQVLESEPEMNIWEMTEGCVCCTMKSDFAASVLTIENAMNPDFLIVEPTGVAQLGNIMENLGQLEYERICMLSPITIVDGTGLNENHKRFPQLFEEQIRSAGTIVVSKTENANADEGLAYESAMRELNATAEVVYGNYQKQPKDWWEKLLESAAERKMKEQQNADKATSFESVTVKECQMHSPEQLICFLEDLVRGCYGEVVRGKGFVRIGQACYHFEMTDQKYIIGEMESETTCECVIIGFALDRAALQMEFVNWELMWGASRTKRKKKLTLAY